MQFSETDKRTVTRTKLPSYIGCDEDDSLRLLNPGDKYSANLGHIYSQSAAKYARIAKTRRDERKASDARYWKGYDVALAQEVEKTQEEWNNILSKTYVRRVAGVTQLYNSTGSVVFVLYDRY